MSKPVKLTDLSPETEDLLDAVLDGLGRDAKQLHCKLFYDELGSQLFDSITSLEEYYPTRTESGIMRDHIDDVVSHIGREVMLIEYGSGSSEKTRVLLDHLQDVVAYVPIDISCEHLLNSAKDIAAEYSGVEVLPLCADYTESFKVPASKRPARRKVIYFPGSTIGNFHPQDAAQFMRRMARSCGDGGGLVIGVDLKKEPAILHRAYNDKQGVTADFNLNILRRINRELDADFNLDAFRHRAIYNAQKGRIEMHLVSLADQRVDVAGTEIHFGEGETIWTESSYKYTLDEFAALAAEAGFVVDTVWTDAENLFSVQYLTAGTPPA